MLPSNLMETIFCLDTSHCYSIMTNLTLRESVLHVHFKSCALDLTRIGLSAVADPCEEANKTPSFIKEWDSHS